MHMIELETARSHQHICARSIDRASAYLRHSCFLGRFPGSTGFPPFFSFVFTVVQAEMFGLTVITYNNKSIILALVYRMAANFRQNTPYHEVAPRGRPSGLVS